MHDQVGGGRRGLTEACPRARGPRGCPSPRVLLEGRRAAALLRLPGRAGRGPDPGARRPEPAHRPARQPAPLGPGTPRARASPSAKGQAAAHRPLSDRHGAGLRRGDVALPPAAAVRAAHGAARAAREAPRPEAAGLPAPRPAASASRASPCRPAAEDAVAPSVPSAIGGRRSAPARRCTSSGRLRPCDYVFEPDPQLASRPRLPLRAGAELRGAVPRPGERGRLPRPGRAGRGECWRARDGAAGGAWRPCVPPFVSAAGARGAGGGVQGSGGELYPVVAGTVVERGGGPAQQDGGGRGRASNRRCRLPAPWPHPRGARRPALAPPWLLAPRRGGAYLVVVAEAEPLTRPRGRACARC